VKRMRRKGERDGLLRQEITIDSLRAYASWRFPKLGYGQYAGQETAVIPRLKGTPFKKIRDIDRVFSRTEKPRRDYSKLAREEGLRNTALGQIAFILALVDTCSSTLLPYAASANRICRRSTSTHPSGLSQPNEVLGSNKRSRSRRAKAFAL
jgi:preprotein translocase subunit Sss1